MSSCSDTRDNRTQLPFGHLNLRVNPFGEMPLGQRHEFAVLDIDPYLQHLARPGAALQFIGEKGRGKTTHLLMLRQRFPDADYVRIAEEGRTRIPISDPLFVDEIQRLSPWQRGLIFRRRVPLVIGTHIDYQRQLRRARRDVLTVQVGDQVTADSLEKILNRRIEFVRRTAGPVPCIDRKTASELHRRFGDDLRSIEEFLYDKFESLEGPGHVKV